MTDKLFDLISRTFEVYAEETDLRTLNKVLVAHGKPRESSLHDAALIALRLAFTEELMQQWFDDNQKLVEAKIKAQRKHIAFELPQ